MVDFLTTDELRLLATHASTSASTVLAGEAIDRAGAPIDLATISNEIGNNVTTTLTAMLGELFPNPSQEMWQSAMSSIWANESDGIGRAGLFLSMLNTLQRTMAKGSADDALAALEERLFTLFVAARKLRRLPAECRFAHTVIDGACVRCHERIVQ